MNLVICRERDPVGIVFLWSRQAQAIGYRVSGDVHYWSLPCDGGTSPAPGWSFDSEFSEMLHAWTAWYRFAQPEDSGPYFVKEYSFTIEAVDWSGNVLARDGLVMIGEAPWWANPDWEAPPCPEGSSAPRAPVEVGTPLVTRGAPVEARI